MPSRFPVRPPRRAAATLALLLLAPPATVAQEAVGQATPARERTAHPEARDAGMRIRCDCGCPPQSAWECACGHASGMVEAMDREARAGATADEIVAGYLEREGAAILLEPPARGWNLTAWLGPSAVILVAGLILMSLLRAWRRRGAREGTAPETGAAPDDDYRQRALDELDRFDRGGLA